MPYTDLHTHILPGLDDGPADLEEALALARALVEAGFGTVAATPHCYDGKPAADLILESLETLKAELTRLQIPLEVLPGAEHAIDLHLPKRLEAGELLTLNNSRFLLIEPPAFQPLPPFTGELIFELRLRGLYPVLAHPERCAAFQKEPGRLAHLIRSGALTQVTLSSLTGNMGPDSARAAALFFHSGLVHLLATDAHQAGGRLSVTATALTQAEKLGGPGTAQKMLIERPAAVLKDQLPELAEPEEPPEQTYKREKRRLFRKGRNR